MGVGDVAQYARSDRKSEAAYACRTWPADALERARQATGGRDVRIGGGPTVIREFLAAGLIDHMHVVVVPILLGRGLRLWDGLEGLEKGYQVEATSSPSGVTHVTFSRAGV